MQQKFIPHNLDSLIERTQSLRNKTIREIAAHLNVAVPQNLKHAKGFIGTLIEDYLGANGGATTTLDFPHLQVELKTIPINQHYSPLESTFVAAVTKQSDTIWQNSWVCKKLSKILWVPIVAEPNMPFSMRYIIEPFLWSPSVNETAILKKDWEELMEFIALGKAHLVSARFGTYLQLRPKAANSKILTNTLDLDGNLIKTVPKGFYLKASFTKQILAKHLNSLDLITTDR